MKRASLLALAAASDLMKAIRGLGASEVKPGVFYVRRKPLVHFHEEDGLLYADVKILTSWERFPAASRPEIEHLLRVIQEALGS